MGSRILLVITSDIAADQVTSVSARFGEGAEVHVVAPASGLSRLDWLTNAEDDARRDAADRAGQVAGAIAGGVDTVEAELGDTSPLLAIDDALRTFAADQIVFITKPDDEASWLESDAAESARARFGLPVTHLVVA